MSSGLEVLASSEPIGIGGSSLQIITVLILKLFLEAVFEKKLASLLLFLVVLGITILIHDLLFFFFFL